MNCGKTFEIAVTAEDPIRCPYCGAGPGVLVRIYDKKAEPQQAMPREAIPVQPKPPQPAPPTVTPPAPPNMPVPMKRFLCYNCNKVIEVPYGVPKPAQCPYCGAPAYMIHRLDKGPGGPGRRGGLGRRGFGRPFW